MHRAILCIGSNVLAAREMIEHAISSLYENGAHIIARSEVYTVSLPYYNCVTEISTDSGLPELVSLTKSLEKEMGRNKYMKAMSIVPIDIDIVIFDGVILRQSDYSSDYFMLGYSRVR